MNKLKRLQIEGQRWQSNDEPGLFTFYRMHKQQETNAKTKRTAKNSPEKIRIRHRSYTESSRPEEKVDSPEHCLRKNKRILLTQNQQPQKHNPPIRPLEDPFVELQRKYQIRQQTRSKIIPSASGNSTEDKCKLSFLASKRLNFPRVSPAEQNETTYSCRQKAEEQELVPMTSRFENLRNPKMNHGMLVSQWKKYFLKTQIKHYQIDQMKTRRSKIHAHKVPGLTSMSISPIKFQP